MPDTIRLLDYFYIETADRPGEAARVLSMLKDAGVHLLAFHGSRPVGGRNSTSCRQILLPSKPPSKRRD